ncbi:MAG: DUF3604 domain-containing protein [Pseudomonadales bacterium]
MLISNKTFKSRLRLSNTLIAMALLFAGMLESDFASASDYSPYTNRTGLEQVYWGDTHLHTSFSTDAGMRGTTIGPDQAYRWAIGEEVTTSTGLKTRIARPLDFLVIADHAENLGLGPMIAASDPRLLANPWGKELHDLVKAGKGHEAFIKWAKEAMMPVQDPLAEDGLYGPIWKRQIDTADRFNTPGTFTAFIGYEWTSSPNSQNLHRVVVFKDNASLAGQITPFSLFDSIDPEDLWNWMESYESKTGGNVLAIPHNGNLSNGLMFATERMNGKAIDADYAQKRSTWEPLTETTQIKGDSETHPFLSPDDEFADYGTWDKANIGGSKPKQQEMLEYEYSRSALKNGLLLAGETGVNPFKFGMIGSTDSHTAIAGTREENYYGKFAGNEPQTQRWKHYVIRSIVGNDELSTFAYEELASGLAAVWAKENTREALFEAMERKEVYATTGTRISVRVFGGWDYVDTDLNSPNMAKRGYEKGVAMGGDLPNRPDTESAPTFMLYAQKDPMGANLDRIQIVKGWLDAQGKVRERVYNVAVSGGREIKQDGTVTPVGTTVDIGNATYSNTIGDNSLHALWVDPDFRAQQLAFYYARVLEIPTPTWPAYDQKRFGDSLPEAVPLQGQERAYTSPIWYTP